MNFDDRLRNHLQTQNDSLTLEPEGVDSIHARSTRRKQRRAAGFAVGCLAVLGAVGAVIFQQSAPTTEFATEGPESVESTTTPPATDSATAVPVAPENIERALPDPGVPLALSPIDTTGAPGGYNLYQSGRSGGLYYVLSTAPGVTYDDVGDDDFSVLQPNTVYSFDGSTWVSNSPTDRFVSGVVHSDELLYAVSTGTKTDAGLSVGRSANAGGDWDWTPIDLTEIFGADPASWPSYNVQQAVNGDQRLVVVSGQTWVDPQDAFALARTSSAPIPADAQVVFADPDGLGWIVPNLNDSGSVLAVCAATSNEITEQLSADSDLQAGLENLFGKTHLTDAEEAELTAWIESKRAFEAQVAEEVARALLGREGCGEFAECEATNFALQQEVNAATDQLVVEWGINPLSDDEPTSEQEEELRDVHQELFTRYGNRLGRLDCDAIYEEAHGEQATELDDIETATWAELGLTVPDEWTPIRAAFLVEEDEVTNLGNVLGDDYGFIVEVAHRNGAWAITVEGGDFTSERSTTSHTSTDGVDWASNPGGAIGRTASLADGTSFAVSWDDNAAGARLLRTDASGQIAALELADLAPDLDTDGFQIGNVATGDFGVAAWAVNWDSPNSNGFESILLYSPDGHGWGATEVVGLEIVSVVVGTDDVLVFTNDPAREEGKPQPIFSGTA